MPQKAEINTEKLNKIISALGKLSKREYEVAVLLSKQLTSKQIADKLCISPNTTDCHRRRIIAKLGIADTRCLSFLKIKRQTIK